MEAQWLLLLVNKVNIKVLVNLGLKFRGKEVHSESIEDNTVNERRHFCEKCQ